MGKKNVVRLILGVLVIVLMCSCNGIRKDMSEEIEESNIKRVDYQFVYGPVDIENPVRMDDNNLNYDFKMPTKNSSLVVLYWSKGKYDEGRKSFAWE